MTLPPAPADTDQAIELDIAAISRISAVPSLLRMVCEHTGMGFAAVARVTDGDWTACAVQDDIAFGLKAGGRLDVNSTLCHESRLARAAVVIDDASVDPVYREHHTPRIYGIRSYISVPIIRSNGTYFGNLCAIDPRPRSVSNPGTRRMFVLIAELIATQLDADEQQQATQTALLSARETAELREQFIAVLGHDLRNPLAVFSAAANLLQYQQQPQMAKLGQRLHSAARRMIGLVDDLLDFARGRLGAGMQLRLLDVADLATALHDVVDELQAAHPGRLVRTDIVITGPVQCDRARLQQLLSNLLANALTHGAAEQPVDVVAKAAGGQLLLSVANGGPAIAPASLSKVFEPYWRASDSATGGGLGLGLYICAQIVQAHGGLLRVTSSTDNGTCFTASLPLQVKRQTGLTSLSS